MNEAIYYAIGTLLVCFTLMTFLLNRMEKEIYPLEYEFKLDPFWPIIAVLTVCSCAVYFIFPDQYDNIKNYTLTDFILPPIFATLIYICFLLDNKFITNFMILISAGTMAFLLPNDFLLFPKYLNFLADRLVIIALLFFITYAFPFLNGLGAVASMQIVAISILSFILAYIGVLPQILSVLSMVYAGIFIAFCFFSWPPEKLILTQSAFASIGFIIGCYVLNCSVECTETSMFICLAFMITETFCALYDRYIFNNKLDYLFMNTTHHRVSMLYESDVPVVLWTIKVFSVNVVLAIMQVAAQEQLALPIFSIIINLWFLSILSGKTKPSDVVSITELGKKSVKKLLNRKNSKNIE